LLAGIKQAGQDWAAAREIVERLSKREDLLPARRLRLEHQLADLYWHSGDTQRAGQLWTALLAKRPAADERRALWVKASGLGRGPSGRKVIDFLVRGKADGPALIELNEALRADPGWAIPWYLLGRQLFFQGAFVKSLEYLEQAAQLDADMAELRAEILRLSAKAAWQAGEYRRALLYLSLLEQYPEAAPDPGWVREWFELVWFSARVRA